jgi:hypothetical protein
LLQHLISKKLTVAPVSIAAVLGFIVGQAVENSINLVGGQFYDQRVRPAVTQELFAQKLDAMPIYQALKRADPEGYSRLRSEVGKRVAHGANETEIQNFTESYAASFRRTNAEAALAASPRALATLAQSLVDILNYLQARDESLCAEYVLKGVASERIRALARETAFAALIEKQATTVFDVIADGRRNARAHEPLTEADVQSAIEGIERRGWTDQMRAALSEPTQLPTLPPGLVCRIHREWFATLGSLPEPTRTRWHREILGPLLRS